VAVFSLNKVGLRFARNLTGPTKKKKKKKKYICSWSIVLIWSQICLTNDTSCIWTTVRYASNYRY